MFGGEIKYFADLAPARPAMDATKSSPVERKKSEGLYRGAKQ